MTTIFPQKWRVIHTCWDFLLGLLSNDHASVHGQGRTKDGGFATTEDVDVVCPDAMMDQVVRGRLGAAPRKIVIGNAIAFT